jgi:hypothetical protein
MDVTAAPKIWGILLVSWLSTAFYLVVCTVPGRSKIRSGDQDFIGKSRSAGSKFIAITAK